MILAITIQKGGAGKTTTAAALAQAAVHRGLSCLAIDLDPQRNLSFALAADQNAGTSADLLQGVPAADLIQHTDQGVDVIPAGRDLGAVTTSKGSARRLQKALAPVTGKYDLIVIDTPGTVGELHYNALMAADYLIIPIEADIYNLTSLYQTITTARQVQQMNKRLQLAGIIVTKYDGRSSLSKQMQQGVIDAAAGEGLQYFGTVRYAVAVKEAAMNGQSLFQYAPKSNPARDYLQAFDQLRQYLNI